MNRLVSIYIPKPTQKLHFDQMMTGSASHRREKSKLVLQSKFYIEYFKKLDKLKMLL